MKSKKRLSYRKKRFLYLNKFSDKIVVEKSRRMYVQYLILPTIFTFIGLQYFKNSGYDKRFLLITVFGIIFSYFLSYFISRKIRKNREIVLDKKGITFSNERTIFWKEIEFFKLKQQKSTLKIYIKTEDNEFLLEFFDLPISKTKLKVLMNSFYKKYNGNLNKNYVLFALKSEQSEEINFNNYLNNTIL